MSAQSVSAQSVSVDAAVRRIVRGALLDAERGDAIAVHASVERLLADGWSRGAVVTSCLAGVEREVGRRWQDGRWSVTQEHTATEVIDDELALLMAGLPAPSLDIEVMVVCAEGEWHITPARMAALVLRDHGFRVRFVGGSVPAQELERNLADSPPDYLAVSCTYPLALAGAARIAAVARKRGIRTLAGGAGFGTNPHRAFRLGLDDWAGSIHEGAQRLAHGQDGPQRTGGTSVSAVDLEVLADRWHAMADEVLDRLRTTKAVQVPPGRPLAPLRQDVTELLQAAHLTALCEDPTLFADHLDWLGSSPNHGGLDAAAIAPTIEILRELGGVYEPTDVAGRAVWIG